MSDFIDTTVNQPSLSSVTFILLVVTDSPGGERGMFQEFYGVCTCVCGSKFSFSLVTSLASVYCQKMPGTPFSNNPPPHPTAGGGGGGGGGGGL